MSRVESKRLNRKSKIYFILYIFTLVVLLVCGLIAVDFEVRQMLAIDEVGLVGYREQAKDQYVVHIMGDDYLIDAVVLRTQAENKFAEFEEIAYNIKEYLINILNQKILQ